MALLDKMIITFTVNPIDQVQIPMDADQRNDFSLNFHKDVVHSFYLSLQGNRGHTMRVSLQQLSSISMTVS